MKKLFQKIIFFLIIFSSNNIYSQCNNLIQNADFESYTSCPIALAQMNLATPWDRMGPVGGSSDYFNSCAGSSGVAGSPGVPQNSAGAQIPNSGNGYAGLIPYTGPGAFGGPTALPDYREYIQQPLSSPMLVGNTYQVSFYVSSAEASRYSSDGMGAYFSTAPIVSTNNIVLPFTPQISNPIGNVLTNSTGWVQISQNFVATQPYSNICIGNFLNNASTQATVTNTSFLAPPFSYYYIDDVSVVCLTCCLLPIELLDFQATALTNNVELVWATATEINNDFFTLERSTNAINFEPISLISGAGNSNSLLKYVDYDTPPSSGLFYYRLKQTDFSGEFTYSEIRSVTINTINAISIYPNPVEDILSFNFNPIIDGKISIQIIDILGNVFIMKEFEESKEGGSKMIDISQLSAGVYILNIRTVNGNNVSEKIIKR